MDGEVHSVGVERLAEVTARFARVHDLPSLLYEVKAIADELLGIEYWGLYLYDAAAGRLRLMADTGFTPDDRVQAERTAMERHPGHVFRTREALHVPDVEADTDGISRTGPRSFVVRSRLWVPLVVCGECVGSMGCASGRPHRFDAATLAALRLVADLTAMVYRNVTAREALVRERDRAEAASAAKGQFLANMSHEVRTPLNGILGMAALLAETPLAPEPREYAQVIRSSAAALLAVVNDILDVSKVEAGMMTVESLPFDLRAACEEVVSLCGQLAAARGVELALDYDPACPALLVGDGGRLRQVMLNLVSNAIRFTPAGSVRLVVREREALPGASALSLAVADTGVGIAADKLEYVFEKFTQADPSTTRRFGGTGLGLAISRALVELMGGSLTVASEQGRGSTFTACLTLPHAEAAATVAPAAGRAWRPLTRPAHVLVVEDNPTNQRVAVQLLRKLGATAEVAGDGAEGVARARDGRFDVVLMDYHMPEMDGLAATRAIRALGTPAASLPILALTASAMEADRRACAAAGMTGYLSKPIDLASLSRALRDVGFD
ncbi:MAG: ATP-binding protein [Polyangiales bacterium]